MTDDDQSAFNLLVHRGYVRKRWRHGANLTTSPNVGAYFGLLDGNSKLSRAPTARVVLAAHSIGRPRTPHRDLRSILWAVVAHDNLMLSGTEAFSYESVRAHRQSTNDAAREPKLEGGVQTAFGLLYGNSSLA